MIDRTTVVSKHLEICQVLAKIKDSKKYFYNGMKILFFILSIMLLYFLLRTIGFIKVRDSFISVGISGAVILVLMGFVENILDSASLKYSSLKSVPLYKIHAINSLGGIMNSVFPWETGEVVKGLMIKKDASLNDSVFGVVLYNYIFKISKPVAILFIIIVSLMFQVEADTAYILLIFLACFVSFIPYIFITLLIRYSAVTKFAKIIEKLLNKDLSKWKEKIEKFEEAIKKFRKDKNKSFFFVFTLQFFARMTSTVTFLIAAYLLGDIKTIFPLLMLANAAIYLANYVVLMLPAKLGVTESTSFLIFSMLGLDGGLGVMIVLVLRIKALFTQSISCLLLPFI